MECRTAYRLYCVHGLNTYSQEAGQNLYLNRLSHDNNMENTDGIESHEPLFYNGFQYDSKKTLESCKKNPCLPREI